MLDHSYMNHAFYYYHCTCLGAATGSHYCQFGLFKNCWCSEAAAAVCLVFALSVLRWFRLRCLSRSEDHLVAASDFGSVRGRSCRCSCFWEAMRREQTRVFGSLWCFVCFSVASNGSIGELELRCSPLFQVLQKNDRVLHRIISYFWAS